MHVCLHVSKRISKKTTLYILRYIPYLGECLSIWRLYHNVWTECFPELDDNSAGDQSPLSNNGCSGQTAATSWIKFSWNKAKDSKSLDLISWGRSNNLL